MANWISIYGPAVTSLLASDVILAQSASGVQKLFEADLLVHKQSDGYYRAYGSVIAGAPSTFSGNPARVYYAQSVNGDAVYLSVGQFGVELWDFGMDASSGSLRAKASGTTIVRIEVEGVLRPGAETYTLGNAGLRWGEVFAVAGTINTSDQREKNWLGDLTPAHLRAAKRIIAEIGLYQWLAAIAEKGEDAARVHIGVRAQAVWQVMVDEGLETAPDGEDPDIRHGFLCFDRWDEADDVPGGDRWGIRPDQLALFLIAAQEARIAALEAAL